MAKKEKSEAPPAKLANKPVAKRGKPKTQNLPLSEQSSDGKLEEVSDSESSHMSSRKPEPFEPTVLR